MTGQDAAGNVAAQPLTFNWTVALQPGLPYVRLNQGAVGATAADNITFAMQVPWCCHAEQSPGACPVL